MNKQAFNKTFSFKDYVSLFLFFTGYFLVLLAVYFKHTRTFIFISGCLFFILCIIYYKNIFYFIKQNLFGFFVLGLFILFLILAIIYSPRPSASLDDFLVSYFFYILLFLNIKIFWKDILKNENLFRIFLWINIGINFLANFYILIDGYFHCKNNLYCYIIWGDTFYGLKEIWTHNATRLSVIYTFNICFFALLFFLLKRSKTRWLCLFLSITDLIYLVWMGRRAALLALFLGLLIAGLAFSKFRKLAFYGLTLIILLIIGIWFSPYRKSILIRNDKINILLSGDYKRFQQAGSLGKRLYAWPIYLKWAIKHPFKGTGLARRVQKKVLAKIEAKTKLEHAHNIFLNLWLQAGLQTAILFGIFYFWIILIAFRCVQSSGYKIEFYFFIWLFIFLIAFLIMCMFEGFEKETSSIPFWITCGLIFGSQKLFNAKQICYD